MVQMGSRALGVRLDVRRYPYASRRMPVLAPRAGNAVVLLAASLLKAAGFACLIVLSAPIGLWCFALLAGAGTGTLRPAVRAVIADETRGRGQALAFQGLFLAMNLAFVTGPLLAEAAIRMDAVRAGVLLVAAIEIGAGLLVFRLVPARGAAKRAEDATSPWRLGLRALSAAQWLLMGQTLLSYAAVGFLIAALVSNAFLLGRAGYTQLFVLQCALYGAALAALLLDRWRIRAPGLFVPLYFCLINLAPLVALWLLVKGEKKVFWETGPQPAK